MQKEQKMIERADVVSVFGSSQAQRGSRAYEEAQQVGALLAQEGLTVCSGGYGGVMEAVSRGAKDAGGAVIGVTTSLFGSRTANPWVDEEIRTATLLERLHKIIEVGHGYLALKGGIGTLTEISTVWSLLQTHSIPPRPFVLLSDPWKGLLDFCTDELIIHQRDFAHVRLASTPAEAVRPLAQLLRAANP
jgi:uncharacterized protein (TIGR00730 family)